jgi:hypothetical protein
MNTSLEHLVYASHIIFEYISIPFPAKDSGDAALSSTTHLDRRTKIKLMIFEAFESFITCYVSCELLVHPLDPKRHEPEVKGYRYVGIPDFTHRRAKSKYWSQRR